MTEDDGRGELVVETGEEGSQGLTLGRGAGVAGMACRIQTAFVADADGVLVVVLAVGSDLLEGTAFMDLTVTGDIVVIADVFPAASQMVGLALTEGILTRGARGAAVQHDEGDGSHGKLKY